MLIIFLWIIFFGGLILFVWRLLDHRADREVLHRLMTMQPVKPERFDPGMIDFLPEPARRYFLYTIEPGTPLYRVSKISMSGRFGMGAKAKPAYFEMTATQILAIPAGFIWKMQAHRGPVILSGSDSECWTRFWLMEFLPVARMGGNPDHARSAFGRYVAEAVFWAPAAMLPGPGIQWEWGDVDRARLTVRHHDLAQSIDVTVAADGQPTQIRFDRWSNANPEKHYQLQPFGAYLSEFQSFAGFRLPTHVEAGNHFGTDHYFPFFVADVTDVAFPS